MGPLLEQGQKVDQEIHQLFATLMAKGRLKAKERCLVTVAKMGKEAS